MNSRFLTNYSETTFLSTIQANLRQCSSFCFSVSFIKKAGLILLSKDIQAALERGATGRLITSTYQNFTDVESLSCFPKIVDAVSQQFAIVDAVSPLLLPWTHYRELIRRERART